MMRGEQTFGVKIETKDKKRRSYQATVLSEPCPTTPSIDPSNL